ncbi:MAG: hypothetical protein NUV83_02105 [Candidatus Wolfebacteria bacterium]|nr:hypothetical protein [Candidatus Wolfebacteria bacterium]
MHEFKIKTKAFSILEVVIYITIFTAVIGLVIGIFISTVKIGNRETASAEVTSQLNFVLQYVERLAKQSSNFDIVSGTTTSTLKLRMPAPSSSPTCVFLSGGVIKIAGPDASNRNCDFVNATNLTNGKVTVDRLNFTKITFYPGHDNVLIDVQLTYNSSDPQSRVVRSLQSAISRVSAATFDDNLLPGSDNTFDFGLTGTRWRNGLFSGNLRAGSDSSHGLILTSPNGTCYRLTVSDAGTLSTISITCP